MPYVFYSAAHGDLHMPTADLPELCRELSCGMMTSHVHDPTVEDQIRDCTVFVVYLSGTSHSAMHLCNQVAFAAQCNVPALVVETNAAAGMPLPPGWNSLTQPPCKVLYWNDPGFRSSLREALEKRVSLNEDLVRLGYDSPSRRLQKFKDVLLHGRHEIKDVFELTSHPDVLTKLFNSRLSTRNRLSVGLDIKFAYVTQLRLLTGLITRLEENWSGLADGYRRLTGDPCSSLETFHRYMEFCWLLWGPSVDTSDLMHSTDTNYMVGQVSLGDEANSLPLIAAKEDWLQILPDAAATHGRACRLRNLEVVDPFAPEFDAIRAHPLLSEAFDEVALLFTGDSEVDEPVPPANAALNGHFYNTAYVWLMLEQVTPNVPGESLGGEDGQGNYEVQETLAPGRTIPFFEHANLASDKGLGFLKRCLARKAIEHVLECDRDPAYAGTGYYRYAMAIFDDLRDILEAEVMQRPEAEQPIIHRRLHIPAAAPRTSAHVVRFARNLGNTLP